MNGGYDMTHEFKKNGYSTYERRTHFTPIWYPDGSYTPYTWLLDCWTPAGMLSMNLTDSITIDGNLWSDWHIAPQNQSRGSFCRKLHRNRRNILMKTKKIITSVCTAAVFASLICMPAYAASGDVAGAIEGTWQTASQQIKTVVDHVVFPAIDLILAVFFFGKLGTAYFDYRKHGQFEWAAPAILFACLVFTLTAPLYIWQILGI